MIDHEFGSVNIILRGDVGVRGEGGEAPAGSLLKDAPREEVFRAIRAAARGQPLLAPAVAARLMNRLRAPADAPLSERELEVLR